MLALTTLLLAAGLTPVGAQEQEEDAYRWRISGYVFGDFYWVAKNHTENLEDRNGFWVRRMYLTFDRNLTETLATRIRFEANSPGDFTSSTKIEPFLKDLYIRWRKNAHDVYLGLAPTPTWTMLEGIWGYRFVEKTVLDLQKFGTSRDFGVSFRGALDGERKVRYHAMIANGSGTKGETGEGKKAMGALAFYPTNSFVLEGYIDYEGRPGDTDRRTYQAFAGFTPAWGRVGLQAVRQHREVAGGDALDLDVASVFGVFELTDTLNLLTRYDRMFDPNPDGEKISYLPFDRTAGSSFALFGVDIEIDGALNIIPNVEWVFYDESSPGSRPDQDVIPRVTFFWQF